MCSSGRPLCTGNRRPPTNQEGSSSGSQYALCALGVGLVALGVVMIVWSIVPSEGGHTHNATTTGNGSIFGDEGKTSSVAYVLVGSGAAMLLLAICLGVRNKKRQRQRETAGAGGADYVDHVRRDQDEESTGEPASPSYDVPTYEEAVTSGRYPIRQSNLRQSYQLPSYEDLIGAVENEGLQPREGNGPQPAPGPGPQPAAPTSSSQPARSSSRASRLLRPLRVRRIKSEKLHVKDIRLNIQNPGQSRVAIEPLTPPPQYEDKPPQLPTEAV
ncbi:transmembrane protein 51b [Ctenopharyngodon idella]|uniref:transmembrane protein 51b n=1 Tax=Ctenopharyngodon idella TaxID=7959 RepID=UPI0022320461|nr:transmembrane protein 51b [Ctenopharyngodon idella]XP_051768243.1 transmembrane protein 51b [Ctenopharyngodon idella]